MSETINKRVIYDEKTSPEIFVIVPVYNSRIYLSKCIESVLRERKVDLKLILVDDGSTDGSEDICDKYSRLDKRVSVIHQQNRGQIIARNQGLKYIKEHFNPNNYDIVMFLDSDDTFKIDTLTEVYKVMSDLSIDMMIFGMDRVVDNKIVTPYRIDKFYGIVEDKKTLYKIVLNDWSYNPVCAKAIRVTLIQETDISKYGCIRYGEDLIQSLPYYKDSNRVFFSNESLYNYTINPQSVTQTITEKPFEVDFTVRQLVMEFLISEDVFDYKDWNEYLTYCIYLITNKLKTICMLNVDMNKKVELLKEIRFSEYFNKYIKNAEFNKLDNNRDNFLYLLFLKKHFYTIALIGSSVKSVTKFKEKRFKNYDR